MATNAPIDPLFAEPVDARLKNRGKSNRFQLPQRPQDIEVTPSHIDSMRAVAADVWNSGTQGKRDNTFVQRRDRGKRQEADVVTFNSHRLLT